jgi:spore maturation protein CgeB
MFNELKIPDLEIYGEGWDGLNTAVKIGDRRITPSERRHIYVNSTININLHSSSDGEGDWNGDFVNPRTFEIAGLGGFQLTDARELLPLHFDLKNEIPVFESPSSMMDAIKYYLSHESERNEMAANARARVLKEHTYRHRAMEILSLAS